MSVSLLAGNSRNRSITTRKYDYVEQGCTGITSIYTLISILNCRGKISVHKELDIHMS